MFVRMLKGFLLLLFTCALVSAQTSRHVTALVFQGNQIISQQELSDLPEKCLSSDAHWNDKFDREVLSYCLRRLKFSLAEKGFLQATVGTFKEQENEDGLRIIVPVDEGALYRLGEVQIRGAKLFSPAKIREMLDLKNGDIANGEQIGEWLFDRVAKEYHELGYIRYVAEPKPEFHLAPNSQDGVVDLTVEIDEGKPFKIGSIKFEGNGDISELLLREQMLVHDREIFNEELLRLSLKLISETDHFEAIDADKDVDYKLDEETGRIDITIHLKNQSYNNRGKSIKSKE